MKVENGVGGTSRLSNKNTNNQSFMPKEEEAEYLQFQAHQSQAVIQGSHARWKRNSTPISCANCWQC